MRPRLTLITLVAASAVTVPLVAQAVAPATSASFGAPYGGFAAYHGTRLGSEPTAAPGNKPLSYRGPRLELAQAYVGRKAAEPTLGVDKKGSVWTVAAAFDAIPATRRRTSRGPS